MYKIFTVMILRKLIKNMHEKTFQCLSHRDNDESKPEKDLKNTQCYIVVTTELAGKTLCVLRPN